MRPQGTDRQLEGSFRTVTRVENQTPRTNTYFLDFTLDDFSPRLRFVPGFLFDTPDSTVELSLRMRASNPDGSPNMQTTLRGQGSHEEGSGCRDGMKVIEAATLEAVQRTMEDLAQKVIYSGSLTEGQPTQEQQRPAARTTKRR